MLNKKWIIGFVLGLLWMNNSIESYAAACGNATSIAACYSSQVALNCGWIDGVCEVDPCYIEGWNTRRASIELKKQCARNSRTPGKQCVFHETLGCIAVLSGAKTDEFYGEIAAMCNNKTAGMCNNIFGCQFIDGKCKIDFMISDESHCRSYPQARWVPTQGCFKK